MDENMKKRVRFELLMFGIFFVGWYVLFALFFLRTEGKFYAPWDFIFMHVIKKSEAGAVFNWRLLASNVLFLFGAYLLHWIARGITTPIRSLIRAGNKGREETGEMVMKRLNILDWVAFSLLIFSGLTKGIMGIFMRDNVSLAIAILLGTAGMRVFLSLTGVAALYLIVRLPRLYVKSYK